MILILILLLILIASPNVEAQQTIIPPKIPLAVRSPYLNCWNDHWNNTVIGDSWPSTTHDSQILGWSVLVRVDGMTYSFLGQDVSKICNGTVNITSHTVTPTRTVVAGQAGPMQVNLTFLYPIEPRDWVKQSIPFSYLAFTADSLDGAPHAVQVYSDVTGEWNSGDRSKPISWSPSSTADVVFHSVTLQTPTEFFEIIAQAQWGTLYYAMLAGDNVTNKIAVSADARKYFAQNGTLDNQHDPNIRTISNPFASFAIARDLGTIQVAQAPVVWTVGYTTDPAINYTDLSGAPPTIRRPYYKIQYSNDKDLIVDFLKDFSNASSRAQQLDNKILQDATSVSNNLGGLVSVAIAQVYESTQLTVGVDANGNLNDSDVMMFMKNIGGAKPNRVNAVETLYAAFPALMYIDPLLGGLLLEPLFRLQASGTNYAIGYAAADLGLQYPSVAISNSNHNQGVEQTGNMLIMTYAYARASGDGSHISKHYSLLTSWADYLITSTLFNSNQKSADTLLVNNQTNLAIKGIIAIKAMSKMSSVVNQTADANTYSSAAARLYAQWKSLAVSSDQHLLAVYGQDSWTLGYNMFADVWLGTNVVESSIYNGHSSFINNLVLTSDFAYFGMPVDNIAADTSVAVSSWSLFVAAMTTNEGLRSQLISRVINHASSTNTSGVFPVSYSSGDGTTLPGLGVASPAQGAVFAPLALRAPVMNINASWVSTSTSPESRKSGRKRDIGAIVGGVIGGVAAVFTSIGVVIFLQLRRRRGIPEAVSPPSTESREAGLYGMVTHLNSPEATRDTVTGTPPGQQHLGDEDPDTEMVAPAAHHIPPPPAITPFPQPVVPVPVNKPDKKLARLRAETLGSRQSQVQTRSTLNVSQPETTSPSNLNAATESGEAPSSYDTRRIHSEFVSIRREMERLRETERLHETERLREMLRAEGSVSEAPPPSYSTEGDRLIDYSTRS